MTTSNNNDPLYHSDFRHLSRKVNLLTRMFRLLLAIFFAGCGQAAPLPVDAPAVCERPWRVVQEHPHDPTHFTQGLVLSDGRLFESIGLYGRSAVHEIQWPGGGSSLRSRTLPAQVFGEGISRVGDRLIQLTWREQIAFMYDLDLKLLNIRPYRGEGWGLTTWRNEVGERLILSDGTSSLRVLHPETLEEKSRIEVRDRGKLLPFLNELEFVRGEILANIWHSDRVVAIGPGDGHVRGSFDFSALRRRLAWPAGLEPGETDLNGLAYDERSGRLLVTGKLWPKLFELEIGDCGEAPREE